jgi:basic membrane protein A and related proteins
MSTHRAAAVLVGFVAGFALLAGCSQSGSNELDTTTPSPGSAGGTSTGTSAADSATDTGTLVKISVAYLVPGTLGDKGFLDGAEAGVQQAKTQLGASVTTVEGGANNSPNWTSELTTMSGGANDVVVTGGAQVVDTLTSVAANFPKQDYIMFDAAISAANIASITFRQNDVGFLAGVLASLVSADPAHYPLAGGRHNVGVVGGQNISAINDFIVGFEAGAKAVDPTTTVQKSYVGSFSDTTTAYNQAKGMFANGADVVFAVAGQSGLGALKAAADSNKYAIGVDSDQNDLYPGHVLASALKNVDIAVYHLLDLKAHGRLQTGHTYVYGIANDGVQLKVSSFVTVETSNTVIAYYKKVADGQIDVPCVDPFCAEPTG